MSSGTVTSTMSQHGLGRQNSASFKKNGLCCALLGVLSPHTVVPGHYLWVVVVCSYREAESQCSNHSQPHRSHRPQGFAAGTTNEHLQAMLWLRCFWKDKEHTEVQAVVLPKAQAWWDGHTLV